MVSVDISNFKSQILISEFLCQSVTVFYNLLLKIKTGNICPLLPYLHKIVVKDEGQIGFAAAEIYDIDLVPVIVLKHVINHLHKSVYLFELIVHGLCNLAILCEYTQFFKHWYIHALFEDVFLLAVISLYGHLFLVGFLSCKMRLALFAYPQLVIVSHCK